MKKTIVIGVLFLLVLLPVGIAKKPVAQPDDIEYWDIDGDGTPDEVWLEIWEHKKQDKQVTEYYTPNWEDYIGEEQWVDGELIYDSFSYND